MITNIETESEKEEKSDISPMVVASVVESATNIRTEIRDENRISIAKMKVAFQKKSKKQTSGMWTWIGALKPNVDW